MWCDACLFQRADVALVAIVRNKVFAWPLDMRDTAVSKVEQVAHSAICSVGIVGAHPGGDLFLLVVDSDDGHTLLIELGELRGERTGIDGKQPRGQLRGEQTGDD